MGIVSSSAVQAADFVVPKGHAIKPAITPLPAVRGPIPVTQASWPFAAAAHAVTPRDLSKDGYVEEEYFVSGRANVSEWPALNQLVSFAQGPYTTRILVRRPRDRGATARCPFRTPCRRARRAVLKRLYPRASDYVSKVKAATQRVLEERWITREDAAAIESEAEKAAAGLD